MSDPVNRGILNGQCELKYIGTNTVLTDGSPVGVTDSTYLPGDQYVLCIVTAGGTPGPVWFTYLGSGSDGIGFRGELLNTGTYSVYKIV